MLAHAVKNLDKIIESMEESEYSERMDGRSYGGRSYDGGRSMARGRNARRDSMGRYASDGYSNTGDMADQLRNMMDEAPDERTRQELQRLASKLDR